jgi:HSP20 family protein
MEEPAEEERVSTRERIIVKEEDESPWVEDEAENEEGELTVDVYQTADMIVVKSMIAGVRPEDLDISITRDMVTIKGKREEERVAKDEDYVARELYWGSFSRAIELPEEIDVDEAEAIEKHGLLILKLPKLDKRRQSKLKVKTA